MGHVFNAAKTEKADARYVAVDAQQQIPVSFVLPGDDDLAGPGYVARVDYFEVAGDPITDEDASIGGDPAPTANDDAFTTAAGTALVLTVASDLLGNDTDDDPLTVTGYGTPQFGTLTPSADAA